MFRCHISGTIRRIFSTHSPFQLQQALFEHRKSTRLFSSLLQKDTAVTSASFLRIRKHFFFCASGILQKNIGDDVEDRVATMSGEECYQLALEYFKKYTDLQKEIEEKNAKEQYEAMMNAHEKNEASNNKHPNAPKVSTKAQNRQANVAVVQTIVKQTKEERKNRNPVQKEEVDAEQSLLEQAHHYMQSAAFIHGHSQALVQIANETLELAKSQSDQTSMSNLFEYVSSPMNSSVVIDDKKQSYQEIAKMLYQEAINRDNNTAAMFNLAHLLWTEAEADIESNSASSEEKKLESLSLFHRAATEFNDSDALYFLGFHYISLLNEEEIFSPIVLSKLLKQLNIKIQDLGQLGYDFLQKASDLDHGGASYYLSLLHRNGNINLSIEPSLSKFQHFLDKACKSGNNSDALFLRGHCIYHREDGYGKSTMASSHHMKEALDDFLQAGELGNPDGYISAGALIFNGHGTIIPQDHRRAFELYQEAAEMGSKEGWRNVVACYALGTGVPKCEQTAKYIAETMLKDEEPNLS